MEFHERWWAATKEEVIKNLEKIWLTIKITD